MTRRPAENSRTLIRKSAANADKRRLASRVVWCSSTAVCKCAIAILVTFQGRQSSILCKSLQHRTGAVKCCAILLESYCGLGPCPGLAECFAFSGRQASGNAARRASIQSIERLPKGLSRSWVSSPSLNRANICKVQLHDGRADRCQPCRLAGVSRKSKLAQLIVQEAPAAMVPLNSSCLQPCLVSRGLSLRKRSCAALTSSRSRQSFSRPWVPLGTVAAQGRVRGSHLVPGPSVRFRYASLASDQLGTLRHHGIFRA